MLKQKDELIFDALKIFFIIFILIAHHTAYLGYNLFTNNDLLNFIFNQSTNSGVNVGVTGFIFLSGLLLTYNSLKRKENTIDKKSFFKKRLIRIVPLYYFALIFYIIFHSTISITNFIAHLLMIHVFFPQFTSNPGSLWFVGLIVQFYLVYPLLFNIYKKSLRKLIIISVVIYILSTTITYLGFDLFASFPNWIIPFAFGMIFAGMIYNKKDKKINFTNSKIIITVFSLTLIASVISLIYNDALIKDLLKPIFQLALLTAVYFIFLALIRKLDKMKKVISSAAYSTFCVFLFHRPLWNIMKEVRYNLINTSFVLSNQTIKSLLDIRIVLIVVGIPLIFLFGYFLQKFYDKIIKKVCKAD